MEVTVHDADARNSNELNAAYAADGYARVKEGSIGALLTTYVISNSFAVAHHSLFLSYQIRRRRAECNQRYCWRYAQRPMHSRIQC